MAPKRKVAAKSAGAEEAEVHANEESTVETPVAVPAEAVVEATPEEATNAVAAPEAEAPAAAEVQAEAVAEAPYTPVAVAGSPVEIYSQLQSLLTADSTKVNFYLPQLLELVHASESIETPILMRVRFVELVGHVVSQVRDNAALRKIVTSLVKIVGGEDNTPQLLTAAVQAFAGLGPVSVVDKNWEYLAREGADVLMQVMIDTEAFPESVRLAAAKSLNSLTHSAFRSVVAKLLHWLSLDREDDEEEQIQKERRLAMSRLSHIVTAPFMRKHWTPETEKFSEPLLQHVIGTLDRREFAQVARIVGHLPLGKEKGNLPLLEWFLATYKLDDAQRLDAVTLIDRYLKPTVEYDMVPALEAAGLLSAPLNVAEESSVNVAKVIDLACRITPADAAEKLLQYVYAQVTALMADMRATLTSANLITVEALLFAAVAIARKRSAEVLQKLNDDAFNAAAIAAAQAAAVIYNEVVFAVKKAATKQEANTEDADAAASLLNIKTILEAFAAKRLPLGEIRQSWHRAHNPMPTVKRSRDAARAVLPPPPGSHAAEAAAKNRSRTPHQPDNKRRRTNSTHGGNNNNNRNNNGGNNNSNNKRSSSRNDRRPRRDSRR